LFDARADSADTVPSPINIADLRTSVPDQGPSLRVVFEDTLQPFIEISCAAAAAYVITNQSAVARMLGDFARARELIDDAGRRFEALDDERGRADVHARRAYLELAEGSVPAARDELDRALAVRRQSRDARGTGLALTGLGLLATVDGDTDTAERHLAEALELFRRAGDRGGLVSVLWRAAELEVAEGRPEETAGAAEQGD